MMHVRAAMLCRGPSFPCGVGLTTSQSTISSNLVWREGQLTWTLIGGVGHKNVVHTIPVAVLESNLHNGTKIMVPQYSPHASAAEVPVQPYDQQL